MHDALRHLFFLLVVRPIVIVVLGLNLRRRELLPLDGPAIVIANHNSHLDALVLMTLFKLKTLRRVRPVAAADYFLARRWLAWFSLKIIGIVPLQRRLRVRDGDPLAPVSEALERGQILLLFPEGTRGEPEKLDEFRSGIAHLARRHPEVPITPVFLHGLGKALPRNEALLVPFICDVFVGEPFHWKGDRKEFMQDLQSRMRSLSEEGQFPDWT